MLKAAPALTPSSVHMPPQQPHGEEEVARETAGEFTAAAARARQPDHQAYEQAEHEAGLAGQGAKVGTPGPRRGMGCCCVSCSSGWDAVVAAPAPSFCIASRVE